MEMMLGFFQGLAWAGGFGTAAGIGFWALLEVIDWIF